jgi:VWFA-related protein
MRLIRFAAIVGLLMPAGPHAADAPITLDVVVTDAKLRPVKNLTPADFEVDDFGERRSVEAVRLHSGGGRALAIFLDEYHVQSGESSARARAALEQFVSTALRDGDTVAVMRPLDPLNGIVFTDDRNTLLRAIANFEGRKGDYAARSTFEENFISRDPRTADVTRAQVVASGLQALAARLGEGRNGRKALVLVSEGFAAPLPRAVVYAANRNGVAIYPIDPSPDPTPHDPMLRFFAEQTGGLASTNEGDLMPGLIHVVADLDEHYLITYQPVASADGKFHPMQVRVKRSGLQARARAGYWAANPPVAVTAATGRVGTGALPFRPSHASAYIRPWIGMSRGADGLTNVTVAWEAGEAPPRNQRLAAITLKAVGADGRVLFQNRISPGDRGRAAFDAAPGYAALEMIIQSSTGETLDTDYRGLSIPNLQVTKPTFATPQLLRTQTARSFTELSANADALPVASRIFSRTERLLVRVPVYGPGDTTPEVTATLLNRRGNPMRKLQEVIAELPHGIVQFDLPLSSLAPDEYRIELVGANTQGPRDEAREMLVFRVAN